MRTTRTASCRRLGLAAAAALLLLPALAPGTAGANKIRLKVDDASPNPALVAGQRKVRFRYEIAGQKRRDIVIQAVRKSDGEVVRRWRRDGVKPHETQRLRWNGINAAKRYAKSGQHTFRIRERGGRFADRSRASGKRRFQLRGHQFPVRQANHRYGDGFGAGRGHQGVDIFAPCGKPVVAARAGRVKHRASGGAAGHYVVISGRKTKRDFVYMHLRKNISVKVGDQVNAGQRIGRVGQSGNARGCHLHFELWSGPGWYSGGSPIRNVKKIVKRWDRFTG